MQASINSYTTDTPVMCIARDNFAVANIIRVEQWPTLKYSLIVKAHQYESSQLNSRAYATLGEIDKLEDNWDGEGTPAPMRHVKNFAKALVEFLDSIGQSLYNLAPGPSSEIMIDVRKGSRSFEILLYQNKTSFVTFSEYEESTQGKFDINLLPDLLTWVNQ